MIRLHKSKHRLRMTSIALKEGQQMQYVNDVCVIWEIRRASKEVIEMQYGYSMEKYNVTLMTFFEASRETFRYIVIWIYLLSNFCVFIPNV